LARTHLLSFVALFRSAESKRTAVSFSEALTAVGFSQRKKIVKEKGL